MSAPFLFTRRLALATFMAFTISVVGAEEPTAETAPTTPQASANLEANTAGPEEFAAFEKLLTGSTLRGHFTLRGAPEGAAPQAESYQIQSIRLLSEDGRRWLFTVSFRHGEKDWALPLPIQVEWAGKTPVITLENFKIPGMGTFSARVLFADGMYAGTWAHGTEAGGHLYGILKPKK